MLSLLCRNTSARHCSRGARCQLWVNQVPAVPGGVQGGGGEKALSVPPEHMPSGTKANWDILAVKLHQRDFPPVL